MNIYLIIYLFISTLDLGFRIANHGKPRTPENGWSSLIVYVIGVGLVLLAVLYK
jgi:hypothetical protein